jgi:hypothetical protein
MKKAIIRNNKVTPEDRLRNPSIEKRQDPSWSATIMRAIIKQLWFRKKKLSCKS